MRDWDPLPRVPGSTIAPCKDCPDRSATCHATCEKYLTWSKRQTELREEDHRNRNKVTIEWARDRRARQLMWERNHKR